MRSLDAHKQGDSQDAALNNLIPTHVGRGVTSINAYPVREVKSMCDMDDEELREALLNRHYLYGLR